MDRKLNGDQNTIGGADTGAAYVFVRSGTSWSQKAYLKADDSSSSANFGFSVSISGTTIVVGAYGRNRAYVFVLNGSDWVQQASVTASNAQSGDYFGSMVAVAGDVMVVSADNEDSNAVGVNGDLSNNAATDSGAVYVFAKSGTTWTQQADVVQTSGHFGWGLAIDEYIVAGNDGRVNVFSKIVNQAPTNIAMYATSIPENKAANTVIGTLSTTDPDAGDTFTYTLVTGT
jgi:hypothetical protein